MIAGVEQLQVQPVSAPFEATNAIVSEAVAAGKLIQIDALANSKSIDEARIAGHAVTVARMALAIDNLVLERDALATALRAAIKAGIIDLDGEPDLARAALARITEGA